MFKMQMWSFLIALGASSIYASAAVEDLIHQRFKHIEEFYQDLHQYPELSGQEERTAKKVADEFRKIGLEVQEKIGGHGVVGVLRNGEGPITMIRSDLDGLPVPEATGLKYASKNAGVMHACGHDFHTASLVGTAYVMAQLKDKWKGTLIFLAQPAEETGAGAERMVRDGLFKKIPKPQQVLALHTSGKYQKGKLGMVAGPALANVDSVDLTFRGKGAHGSSPENGVDPFMMSAEFIIKTQTLLGREKPARHPAVISVGSLHGGAKHNIIPDEVKLQLTVRSYDPEIRKMVLRRMREAAEGIAKTAMAPAPLFAVTESTEATINSPELGERLKKIFLSKIGPDSIIEVDPSMGGEDFGVYGSVLKIPSYFFWVGQKNEKEPQVSNHSPKFAPDFKGTAPLAMRATSFALLDLHSR